MANFGPDFGVLGAVRQLLGSISDNIHLAVPPAINLPLILLELEEIWTSMPLGRKSAHTRLKLKASIFSNPPSGRESLDLSVSVRRAMDGQVLSLTDGKKGMMRLSANIVETPAANKPRNVQQYYEVLIRG